MHFTPEICKVLLSLHAFTGCDTTNTFIKRGKIHPLNNKNNKELSTVNINDFTEKYLLKNEKQITFNKMKV